jgi:probable HAF family extracellular repeat protein
MRDLGTLGGAESAAALSTSELGRRSINNAGEVVGVATTALGETHAFLWKGGIMHDLGISGVQRTNAVGINQAHQIVGYSISTFDSPPRGFFFDAGTCPIGAPASGTR